MEDPPTLSSASLLLVELLDPVDLVDLEELPEDSASTSTFMVVPVVLEAHMDPEVLWDLLVVFLDLLEVLWDLPEVWDPEAWDLEVLASPSTECSSLPEVVTA